jgi:hypothetical protein
MMFGFCFSAARAGGAHMSVVADRTAPTAVHAAAFVAISADLFLVVITTSFLFYLC